MTSAPFPAPSGPTVLVLRRPWGRRLLLWSVVSVLALGAVVGALGAAAWQTVPELSQMADGLRISIDGRAVEIGAIHPMHIGVGGMMLVIGLALVFILLPLALILAALALVTAVAGALALGLLAGAGVAALVLSPLIAAGLLVRWALRQSNRSHPGQRDPAAPTTAAS